MCLYLKTADQETERKFAKHDISCYKIVIGYRETWGEWNYDNNVAPEHFSVDKDHKLYFVSPFQNYAVFFGTNLTDGRYFKIVGSKIPVGVNKFVGVKDYEEKCNTIDDIREFMTEECYGYIGSGCFHSFKEMADAKDLIENGDGMGYGLNYGGAVAIVKCVIPKGAEYYEGYFDGVGIPSYGSRSIRYEEIVDIKYLSKFL